MSKKVIYFNDDEILKGGDMDSVISDTNHNTLLTYNSNSHVGGNEGNNNCGNRSDAVIADDAGASPSVYNRVDTDRQGQIDNQNNDGEGEGEGESGGNEEGVGGDEGGGGGGGGGGNGRGEGGGEGGGGNEGGEEEGGGGESGDDEEGGEDGEDTNRNPSTLRGGASESTQLNQLVEQLLATNMAKISNQLTSQSGGGLNITDVLSGINEQLSNLNTNIGKIIQLNNKNI